MRRLGARKRERGAAAIMVALLLPVLLGFAALAIDVGHLYLVRNELQNASDSAALAGVRGLDGTIAGFAIARVRAQQFAAEHKANQSTVQLDLNATNAENGDIVLGRWHSEATPAYFEWISDPTVSPMWINAVKVRNYRTGAQGNAVQSWLAQFIGVTSSDVASTAVAVGGGPGSACSFPFAIPDCIIMSGTTGLQCSKPLTFSNNLHDNAGLTSLAGTSTNTAVVKGLIDNARNGICNNVDSGDRINVQNGNNIVPIANAIRDWIAANGGPITVTVPILATGMSSSSCSPQFNQSYTVAGFAKIQISKVWPPGGSTGNQIDITFLCNQMIDAPAGGTYYGAGATQIFISQ